MYVHATSNRNLEGNPIGFRSEKQAENQMGFRSSKTVGKTDRTHRCDRKLGWWRQIFLCPLFLDPRILCALELHEDLFEVVTTLRENFNVMPDRANFTYEVTKLVAVGSLRLTRRTLARRVHRVKHGAF